MNTKKKFRIAYPLTAILITGMIIAGLLLFQSCEQEVAIPKNRVTKENVLDLAKKHNIPLKLIDISTKSGEYMPSLNELEKLFLSYKECRSKDFSRKLYITKIGNKLVFQTKRSVKHTLTRLKSGPLESENGMWNGEQWYYDLTWLDVDVAWQDKGNQVTISSNYNGVNIYSYSQDNYTYRTSGDTIYFQVTGTQSMTIGFENFGIHFTDDVNASGWINTSSGDGQVKIDKSDYWF